MTTQEYLKLDREHDRDLIAAFNRELTEKHPYLLPRNRFTGETPDDYDYTWTELDLMPGGWRIAFGDEMCTRITEALKKTDSVSAYRIADIKEKWGRLCWYDYGAPEEVRGIISEYMEKSEKTCIRCGRKAQWISRGWISPYCVACARKLPSRRFPEDFDLINRPALSPRQEQVLKMIRDYRFVTGRAPTYREIGERMKISRQAAWQIVESLREKDYIERGEGGFRAITPKES